MMMSKLFLSTTIVETACCNQTAAFGIAMGFQR
jgi:hypothetical protein